MAKFSRKYFDKTVAKFAKYGSIANHVVNDVFIETRVVPESPGEGVATHMQAQSSFQRLRKKSFYNGASRLRLL